MYRRVKGSDTMSIRRNRQQRFSHTVIEGLEKMGATKTPEDCSFSDYPYQIETKYGPLILKPVTEENSRTARTFTCYGRFTDDSRFPEAALSLGSNPFTGKWNFHSYVGGHQPEEVANSIIESIKKVLPEKVIAKVIFGDGPSRMWGELQSVMSRAEDDEDMYAMAARELVSYGDQEALCITTREFNTEAEAAAYFQGIEDMDGWMGCAGLEDNEAEELEKVLQARDELVSQQIESERQDDLDERIEIGH
jgi:hypothetical protein